MAAEERMENNRSFSSVSGVIGNFKLDTSVVYFVFTEKIEGYRSRESIQFGNFNISTCT